MGNILEIEDLHVEVNGQELLHGANLAIPDGEVHALLGPNGSGKTSLMMTIMGFSEYIITRGRIIFEGQDITQFDITQRARMGISIAQQRPPTIIGVKLRDILDYVTGDDPERASEVNYLLQESDTSKFLDRDINDGLSGGEIKRVELLQLLAAGSRFSMMDEPESGVDLVSLSLIGKMANELFSRDAERPVKRRSGLVITHTGKILDFIEADKAHIMLDGVIGCSGNPHLIFDTIAECGYEECVRCAQEGARRAWQN